jgi:membrane-bound ClpP family serine protease
VIALSALLTVGFFGFVLRKAVTARSLSAARPAQVLVGVIGEAREDLAPEGQIFVAGAAHDAVSTGGLIPRGTHVIVVAQQGSRLAVAPVPAHEQGEEAVSGGRGLAPGAGS